MRGPDADYALGEAIARAMFAPTLCSHRVTVEQMATLEPALSESVCGTLLLALRQALDEAVRRGVPRDAAFDFLFGHINVELAIAFELVPGAVFSDAALEGRPGSTTPASSSRYPAYRLRAFRRQRRGGAPARPWSDGPLPALARNGS